MESTVINTTSECLLSFHFNDGTSTIHTFSPDISSEELGKQVQEEIDLLQAFNDLKSYRSRKLPLHRKIGSLTFIMKGKDYSGGLKDVSFGGKEFYPEIPQICAKIVKRCNAMDRGITAKVIRSVKPKAIELPPVTDTPIYAEMAKQVETIEKTDVSLQVKDTKVSKAVERKVSRNKLQK